MELSVHLFLSSAEGFLIEMEFDDRYRQAQRTKYDCLLFGKPFAFGNFCVNLSCLVKQSSWPLVWTFSDLDDTLYPYSTGIATACRNNIEGKFVFLLGPEIHIYFSHFAFIISVNLYFWCPVSFQIIWLKSLALKGA